jgi:hypothetical protein
LDILQKGLSRGAYGWERELNRGREGRVAKEGISI